MTIAIIWMITNLIIGVGFFLTAVIPGINFVGVPIVLAISAVINTVFIVWMMIRFMQKMNEQGFKNYNRKKNDKKPNKIYTTQECKQMLGKNWIVDPKSGKCRRTNASRVKMFAKAARLY